MSTAPDISIIILNYNGRVRLRQCLTALSADASPECETLVVDNGSSDGSTGMVREQFPLVRVVALPENAGFARGNNAGATAARGRYLAFLNNDTVPRPGWALRLRDGLERSGAGFATARIVMLQDPDRIDSAGDGYLRAGGAFKCAYGRSVAEAGDTREVFGACGAACMVRRSAFEDVGGFDDDFFMVYEDVDLSYRLQLRGHRCLYVAEAVVAHAGSATLGLLSPAAVFYGQRNLEWVYVKDTPWPILLRSLPVHLVYGLVAAAHFTAAGRLRPFLAGKAAAVRGLPAVWRKRRAVQAGRTRAVGELWSMMERGWLWKKQREKRVARGLVGSR